MGVIFSLPMVIGGLMLYLFIPQPTTWVDLVAEYNQQQFERAQAQAAPVTPPATEPGAAVTAQVHPSNTGNAFEDGKEDRALILSMLSGDQTHAYRSGVAFLMMASLQVLDSSVIECDAVSDDPDFIQGCTDMKALDQTINTRLTTDEEYKKGFDGAPPATEND